MGAKEEYSSFFFHVNNNHTKKEEFKGRNLAQQSKALGPIPSTTQKKGPEKVIIFMTNENTSSKMTKKKCTREKSLTHEC